MRRDVDERYKCYYDSSAKNNQFEGVQRFRDVRQEGLEAYEGCTSYLNEYLCAASQRMSLHTATLDFCV